MKSVFVVLIIALVSLSGAAFTMQKLQPSTTSAAGIVTGVSAPPAQINGLPVTEPVSIVLSSLLLLGATTLLRRNRRSLRRTSTPEPAAM